MTGQQLKNSILQLAIQGKLVPQGPNDEPASKLLARIRKEKEQLVKDGKLKKKDLVTTPITDEEKPFNIPENWEWVRMLDVVDLRDGTHDTPSYVEKGYPLITSKDFSGENFCLSKTKYISEQDYLSIIQRSKVDVGDILFSMIGGNIGNQIIVTKDNYIEMAIKNVALYKQYSPQLINNKYVFFYLTASTKRYQAIAAGGAQSFVSLKTLRNDYFPLPPLPEQHRIVEKIEELMPLVEQYGKSQEKLEALNKSLPEALKKSILQEAIMGRLVPQDPTEEPASALLARIRKEKEQLAKDGKLKKKDLITTPITDEEKPFDIPESWEWVKIPQIGVSQLGKTKNPNQTIGTHCSYLCSINVYWDGTNMDNMKTMLFTEDECDKYEVKKGDLLICEGGDCGRAAIWDKDFPSLYQNALHRVRYYCDIDVKYMWLCLKFYHSCGMLSRFVKGETIKHLVKSQLDSIAFPLPPLSEQHRIVKKIEELFDVLK